MKKAVVERRQSNASTDPLSAISGGAVGGGGGSGGSGGSGSSGGSGGSGGGHVHTRTRSSPSTSTSSSAITAANSVPTSPSISGTRMTPHMCCVRVYWLCL